MADTNTNRPRPRPRPKPILKRTENGALNSTPGASSSSSSGIPLTTLGAQRVIEVHDTDEMFMRNRNRTVKTWQKLDQINKEVTHNENDDSSDSDSSTSPRRTKHKRKKKESSVVPTWQRNKKLTRMLSEDLFDDSDGIEIIGESSTAQGKRKRKQRSRSRSITPPPALPEHQIQNAKNVVRQTLRGAVRAPSPTLIDPDESGDTIVFQPELDAIAQEIAEHSHRASSQAPADGADDHIVLMVKWQPHPLDQTGKAAEWQYRIDRHDNFRDLFEATAEDANILSTNLIMTYQGKRFFPSVTPYTLKIWNDTAELVAYEKKAYEYIQKNSMSTQHTAASSRGSVPTQSGGPVDINSDEGEAESEAEGDKFKLILRSSGNKDITLTVRSTTKCGAIVKAFLKKAGLADQYPGLLADASAKVVKKGARKSKGGGSDEKVPQLCIDGDKMDNQAEIGDMDLEDGDMVEVVGL
ncbi:hypothetical protein BDZ97DRAFT_1904414 [Flammula alnicola]|nr:hypothetical protein BDZ97DRAFT_1904414 [Flammula alnicola]